MGGCSAPGCHCSDRRGHKVYRFPTNPERRQRWVINCGRENWTPTKSSCLCENHFERNQFELHRADGKIKLKPNAVPTIFSSPNVAPQSHKSGGKRIKRQISPEKNTQEETMSPTRKSTRVRKSTFKKAESDNELHASTIRNQKKFSGLSANLTFSQDESSSNETSEELGIVEIFIDEDVPDDETSGTDVNSSNCLNCEELSLENAKLKKENEQLNADKAKMLKELSVLQKEVMFVDLALKCLLDEDQQRKLKLIVKTVEHEWEDDEEKVS